MVEMNLSPPKLNFGDHIMDSNTLNIAHFLYIDYGYFLTKNDMPRPRGRGFMVRCSNVLL